VTDDWAQPTIDATNFHVNLEISYSTKIPVLPYGQGWLRYSIVNGGDILSETDVVRKTANDLRSLRLS
jgi:hypothetical protein